MAMRIRTGDEVVVISGKDRGKTGRILRVDRGNDRVFVEGLNIIKRHVRPSQLPGATPEEAAELANHAAGVVVSKLGTATCSRAELEESFRDHSSR